MTKRLILIVLTTCAMLSLGFAVFHPKEKPVKAEFAVVQRGDVHQVAAITGRLAYADERYVYATSSGVIRRICVEPGSRVENGEILLCLECDGRDQLFSALYASMPGQAVSAFSEYAEEIATTPEAVIRSRQTCTVRQVLVEEGAPVAAGVPVMRTSSHQQQIICNVSAKDVEHIEPGMWAWLSSAGVPIGTAIVASVGEETVEPTTGMSAFKVTLLPEGHVDLQEGTAVDADVYLAGSDDVQSLPLEAITERDTVWWVNEGRCTEIPAQIVLCDEMSAWVDLPEGLIVALGEFEEGQRVMEEEK